MEEQPQETGSTRRRRRKQAVNKQVFNKSRRHNAKAKTSSTSVEQRGRYMAAWAQRGWPHTQQTQAGASQWANRPRGIQGAIKVPHCDPQKADTW